ncbi:MAG TPA: multicopper oxidase domain-containing protein [Vicinamibacterales bacterium]|nr:multicopper oxidase domain-containing protein [Vicinamibacterales bacterium]
MGKSNVHRLSRRDLLKLTGGVVVGSVAGLRTTPAFGQYSLDQCKPPAMEPAACAGGDVIEVFPTSPLIGGYVENGVVKGSAFRDRLPIPAPLAPVPRSIVDTWKNPPDRYKQDSHGLSTHQIWPSDLNLPAPLIYRVKLEVLPHDFTSLRALPIDANGLPVPHPVDRIVGERTLRPSTLYAFNGEGDPEGKSCDPPRIDGRFHNFAKTMIYARYGEPCLVRFENLLHENPCNLDRGDFGDPHWRFLTHLHNGHTAPESDGNPNFNEHGYDPTEYLDNLYLNWAATDPQDIQRFWPYGDPREMQSTLWFHDHTEGHTGANVYKGMVGLYPILDPTRDPGDETRGLRLPGVPNPSTGRVDYDIPLAFFDCALDDGVTPHKDVHNGCGETHPEWWGQTYFRHFPNHGFVGDVFTVNGVAYPVLEVKRRKYRFRFLDASIARVYEFMLMSSTGGPQAAPGRQGQYQLPDGEQCMRFRQIASDGGLLSFPIVRDSFKLYPAKRKEVIVDFTRYMDGTPTTKGDVIYLVNTLEMDDGRKSDGGTTRVPMIKIVIGEDAPDNSLIPSGKMRDLPPVPSRDELDRLPHRAFKLERGGSTLGPEGQWLINGQPFTPCIQRAYPRKNSAEVWTLETSGGWIHPIHMHQEEHQVLSRNGVPTAPPSGPSVANGPHPDDRSREDVVALDPGDEVVIYRKFRTFTGKYVAHCHNLAHEDHSMMFGWEIVP